MGKKKTEILNSESGFKVVMSSGTVLTVKATRAGYSASEISFTNSDGNVVAKFRLKDVSGLVDLAHSS